MWLVEDKVAKRIQAYPKSALMIADDLGEMLLNESISIETNQRHPSSVGISAVGIGVPDMGNSDDDITNYFDGTRHLVGEFPNGIHILWNLIWLYYGFIHFGWRHPETREPFLYVPTMTFTCQKVERIVPN